LAIKENEPALVLLNLKKLLILFAMLGNTEYVEFILLHLLLFTYHLDFNHPHPELFLNNLFSFVGEDIEIANRALSHCSSRNSRRSEHDLLDRSYRLLRYMRHTGLEFGEDMTQFHDIFKGNRRYRVNNEEVFEKAITFWNKVIQDLKEGSFTHYKMPYKLQKTSKRIPRLSSDSKEAAIVIFQTGDADSKDVADKKRELKEVNYLASYDWYYFLENTLKSMHRKKRNVTTQLDRKTIQEIIKKGDGYVSPELVNHLKTLPDPPSNEFIGPRLFPAHKRKHMK
jgi:hypothetical protein